MIVFRLVRRFFMMFRSFTFKSVGANFIFDPFSTIVLPKRFSAGNNVFIGPKAYISADIEFMDNIMVGPKLTVIGGDHSFGVKGQLNRFLVSPDCDDDKIIIGHDAWIGANVTILKGVEIGHGSVIGAGSLVTKSIKPYTVAVGSPCKSIKNVFNNDETLLEHLNKLNYSSDLIKEIFYKRAL